MVPKVCIKTHEDLFWRLKQKEVFMIFVGENLETKVAQKTFRASLGNPGKILRTPKICLLLHPYDLKGASGPVTTILNGQRGKQARNQLGTPGAAKSFLRGDHIF